MDVPLQADLTEQILDATGAITTNVVCRRCGYNLRGLQPARRCPECGTPIGLSVSGDFLRFADPDWVDKIARGIHYILWGLVLAIGCGIAGVAATRLLTPAFGQLIGFVGGLLSFYGAWLLTEPDPSGIGEDRYTNARKIIRFSLLVGMSSELLQLAVDAHLVTGLLATLLTILATLTALISIGGEFAKLVYLEKLAMRIPEPSYARRARFLRWAYTIPLILLICVAGIIAVFAAVAPPTGLVGALLGLSCFMAIDGILVLIFSIMYLFLQYRLGRAFREQASIARATWAAASATITADACSQLP